jgi:pimeloyl-ACP methyl ester carboxylesterase
MGNIVQLATYTRGDGLRTAALVHGASESSTAWLRFADILVDRYDLQLILVDQRGHGGSPRGSSYHITDFVDDLVETLPRGLDFLVGQSLGGRSGALAAKILEPAHFIGVDPAFALPFGYGSMMRATAAIQSKLPRTTVRRMGIRRTGRESIERQMANWDAWDTRMIPYLAREGRSTAFVPQPPAVPSTLVLADPSLVVPRRTAEKFRSFGWGVRTLRGAPHDMHIQVPVALAAALDDVLTA